MALRLHLFFKYISLYSSTIFTEDFPEIKFFFLKSIQQVFCWSLYSKSSFKKKNMGFLGGSVVKNPPANVRDAGWIRLGKIPHAADQLSPCATISEPGLQSPEAETTKPMLSRAMFCNKRSHFREKPLHCN